MTTSETLTSELHKMSYKNCAFFHGQLDQCDRERLMKEFRSGKLKALVTTGVAGRGIDIPNISHVVLFDLDDMDEYIHRIGRTGRGESAQGS